MSPFHLEAVRFRSYLIITIIIDSSASSSRNISDISGEKKRVVWRWVVISVYFSSLKSNVTGYECIFGLKMNGRESCVFLLMTFSLLNNFLIRKWSGNDIFGLGWTSYTLMTDKKGGDGHLSIFDGEFLSLSSLSGIHFPSFSKTCCSP